MCGLSAHNLASDDAFSILHRNAALTALDINYESHYHNHQCHQHEHCGSGESAPGIGLDFIVKIKDRSRQADHDAGEDQQRHAIADATFGNLLAQPHNEGAARGESKHGHQNETGAGMNDEAATTFFQTNGDTKRLNRAQHHGEVAGPLCDLLAAEFAFLLQLGQGFINHCQELQDDRRRNVRHDAEGKDGHAAKLAAGKEVHEAEHRAAILLEELLQLIGIDAGSRDVAAQTVHRQ